MVYVAAGLCAWPFVRTFYVGRLMRDNRLVLAMQLFRELVFTSIALVLGRFLALSRAALPWPLAWTFSLLGGIIPLMLPNPYMPDFIRLPHLIEVGVSNFLFGCLAAWLLARGGGRTREASATA